MSTDRELLELAAKAADIRLEWVGASPVEIFSRWSGDPDDYPETDCGEWNPLTDDGDALRLATRLCMSVQTGPCVAGANSAKLALLGIFLRECTISQPQDVAVRRVIVRAAAEIGRAMP